MGSDPGSCPRSNRWKAYSRLVALPHSVFGLPFAVGAAAIAGARVRPPIERYGWIVVAVVAARTAAMAFNRWADRDLDRLNPRTAAREVPRGVVSAREALALAVGASVAFLFCAWRLGTLTLALAPVALLVCLGYSFAKRVTAWPHVILGVALAGAPVGAWIAITGSVTWEVAALGLAVMGWVAGFDVLYALADVEFDRAHGVGSVPARYGAAAARMISRALHVVTVVGLVAFGVGLHLGVFYWVGAGLIAVGLLWQQLSSANLFLVNGVIALGFGACAVLEAFA